MKMKNFLFVIFLNFFINFLFCYEKNIYYIEINFEHNEVEKLIEMIEQQEWFERDKLKFNDYAIYLGPYDLIKIKQIQDILCSALNIPSCIITGNEVEIDLDEEEFYILESTYTKYVSKEILEYYDDENIKKIINYALELYTLPYKWGGTDIEKGIDCSYFVKYIYSKIGINLPRTSREQFKVGKEVSKDELMCGDLVFFKKITYRKVKGKTKKYEYINHVGIYLKDNEFIHAARGSKRVTISSLSEPYYKNHFAGARRIVDFVNLKSKD